MTRSLTVLTFNVRQLRDDDDAVRTVLRNADADVVAIQEPPRGPFGGRRLAQLAAATGYEPTVTGARTTALLVRRGLTVTGALRVRLPWRPGRTRRGLALADVHGVRVISAHLSLVATERARHVDRLLRIVAATPGPVVVAGDLNEEPGGPTWRRLGMHLGDLSPGAGPTYTARSPRRRLDAVLAAGGASGHAWVLNDEVTRRASDHLPVLAEVRW